jgi:preprotein translocase subunit YajC
MPRVTDSFVLAMASGGQAGGLLQFLPFAMILAIFYFLILMPMKKRQKKVEAFQEGLKVGDKIVTTSGIYGQITRLNEKSVLVQVAETPQKVRIEVARASVGGYQGQDPVVTESGNASS